MKTATTQQIEDAAFLTSNRFAACFSEPGTGKTLTAITALQAVHQEGTRTLIVAPKIALTQWYRELAEQGIKAAVYRSGVQFKHIKYDSVVITTPALMTKNANRILDWAPTVVIADEAHFAIDWKSQRTKAFYGAPDQRGIAREAKFVWLLTGTPIVRFADDLWPMLVALWPEKLDEMVGSRRRQSFLSKFVMMRPQRVPGGRIVKVPYAGMNEDLLNTALYGPKKIAVRRKLTETTEMPTLRERDIEVDIDAEAGREITKIIKDMSDEQLQGDSEQVKSVRRAFGRAKLASSIEYLDTIDEPTLVLTWHNDVSDTLGSFFADEAVMITGGTPEAARQDALERFGKGRIKFLIGQIGAVGTALDGMQHVCKRVVFVERIGSPALMEQAIARVYRRGQQQIVQVEYLRASHRLEGITDQTLSAKSATQKRAVN